MTKKGWMLAALGLLPAFAAAPATAQGQRIHLGASGGVSQYQDICDRATVPCEPADFSWRAFGGYRFNRYLSAELGYAVIGKADGEGLAGKFEADTKGFDLSALISFPLAGELSAIARLGGYRMRTEINQTGTAVGMTNWAGTSSGYTLGAGLEYFIGFFGLRAEWQLYKNVGTTQTGEENIGVFSLGAMVRF